MKEKIDINNIIKSIGPYSIAVKAGNFIFLSGMIGLKQNSNELASDDLIVQTEHIFKNLRNILSNLNLTTDNIVKSTIYTTEIDKFNLINDVYKKFFNEPYPARSVVGVSRLPLNAKIEIEFILVT